MGRNILTGYRRALYVSPWGCWLAVQVGRYGLRIGHRRGEGYRLALFAPVLPRVELEPGQRFADIWNAGRPYNFRLWRYHPRLRNAA